MKPLRPFAWLPVALLAAYLMAAGCLAIAQEWPAEASAAFVWGVLGVWALGASSVAAVGWRVVVRAEAAASAADEERRRLQREVAGLRLDLRRACEQGGGCP
jgi:uncharacterized protein YggE